jgi:hypothetical protein
MPGRPRAVLLRYTDDEYTEVADAARCAGLTPSGYVAEAALAAASGQEGPALRPERAALAELVRARIQVRKLGTNVNQAARQLNAFGEAPEWLEQAVVAATRAVTELEAAATVMTTATRRRAVVRDRTSDTTSEMATSQRTADVDDPSCGRTCSTDSSSAMAGVLAGHRDCAALGGGQTVDAIAWGHIATTDKGEQSD